MILRFYINHQYTEIQSAVFFFFFSKSKPFVYSPGHRAMGFVKPWVSAVTVLPGLFKMMDLLQK